MARAGTGYSSTESWVSCGIMVVLALIALGVLFKQAHFDHSVFEVDVQQGPLPGGSAERKNGSDFPGPGDTKSLSQAGGPEGEVLELAGFVPAGLRPFSAPERFGSETLSDKIDGKAELYLSAGFVSLRCQRFQLEADPLLWMEIFLYDMGHLRQAYSVFSAQRRSEAESLSLAEYAYKTQNALYWVHGRYYVEVVASAPSPAMMDGALDFARIFMVKVRVEKEKMGEVALFPPEGLEEGSITLLSRDVFSFEKLENVYTARYHIQGLEMTAFIARRQNSGEAVALAQAYRAFLLEMGGQEIRESSPQEAVLIRIMGAYELFFTRGPVFAGIHEGEDRHAAEKLAAMLEARLSEEKQ